MEPKLVVTDMDGTLLDDDHTIPNTFWPLLKKLQRNNVAFAPASGRQLHTLLEQFDFCGNLSVIAENGTVVYHDGRIISITAMPESTIHALLNTLDLLDQGLKFDGGVVLCRPDGAYISRSDTIFTSQCAPYYKKLTVVEDLHDYVNGEVIKIAIFSFTNAEESILPHLTNLNGMNLAVSGENWVDIMSPEANKGKALEILARALGISTTETVAFGDYLNDYELLRQAGTSYAMANAHPRIKEIADHTAPANTEHGVIQILNQLFG